jgi:peptidoglycan/xylan/chitin deacetylase (PgdA/CDA1 family)
VVGTAVRTGRGLSRAVLVAALVAAVLALPPAGAASAASSDCRAGHLALTFDDGPGRYTPAVLDVLARRNVTATFFVTGQQVDARPHLVARAVREGHAIANHTYGHERLTALSNSRIVGTVDRAERAIVRAGGPSLRLVRPPYGAIDNRVRTALSNAGYRSILWTVDPQDWRNGSSYVRSFVTSRFRDGAVILLHDGSSNAPAMLDALPAIVDEAHRRGFCFAPLDGRGQLVRTPFDWRAAGWPFSDVSVTSTHAAAITRLRDTQVTLGCGGDRYCPEDLVTRAQMASFLQRALGLPPGPTDGFRDVASSSPHAAAIGALHQAGITRGCSDDGRSFCPGETIRRDQLASFLQRALELPPGREDRFVDVVPGSTHAAAIGAVDAAGITRGCDATGPRYCPSARVNRAQMASFLVRAVDHRAG